MQQSFYVYNNGDLKRKDNTLRFTSYDGEKRDIPIERIQIYMLCQKCLLIDIFKLHIPVWNTDTFF